MIKASRQEKALKYNNIICASTSPRRIKILKKYFPGIKFAVPDYKEKPREYFFSPVLLSIYYACKKAMPVKNNLVMSFDTIVFRNFKIYGKPYNKSHAVRVLKELSGKIHKVVTGVCIRFNNETKVNYEISKVKFKKLTDKDISVYIKTNEWKDKAGGYGIQGKAKRFIEWYKGDYNNIVGLPLSLILELFKKKYL